MGYVHCTEMRIGHNQSLSMKASEVLLFCLVYLKCFCHMLFLLFLAPLCAPVCRCFLSAGKLGQWLSIALLYCGLVHLTNSRFQQRYRYQCGGRLLSTSHIAKLPWIRVCS